VRDVNKFQRSLILLALYVWQWLDLVQDRIETSREMTRSERRGAADPDWQHALAVMAAPVRSARIKAETGEHRLMLATDFAYPDMATVLVEWDKEQDVMRMAPTVAPPLPLAVVTSSGAVVDTIPTPHIREHRTFDKAPAPRPRVRRAVKAQAIATYRVAELRAAERRVRQQLNKVVLEAMQAAGLTLQEARDIIGAHHYECVLDRVAA